MFPAYLNCLEEGKITMWTYNYMFKLLEALLSRSGFMFC